MLKLINVEPGDYTDEPVIRVIDLSAPLTKTAATSEIEDFIASLEPEPGYTYLHILAMSAGQWYSSNRNGDYFPEDNLIAYHKTFETNPAHLFRHHINKDKQKAYGVVIKSVYNEPMHRVEFVVKAKNELVQDVNDRIKNGDFPATSMALKIPSDTCSICGNVAHTRQEYCTHLRNELNKLYPDGRKVFAINEAPFSGFDISIVIRPADPISAVLTKIAHSTPVGSLELAEIEGVTEDNLYKEATIKKLSELIKEITDGCYAVGSASTPSPTLQSVLGNAAPTDLPPDLVNHLEHFSLAEILAGMAHLGISPSISFLSELIARKKLGKGYEGIGPIVQEFMKTVPVDTDVANTQFQTPPAVSNDLLVVLAPYVHKSSLMPSVVEKRASNVGYAGNGPTIEPTEWEEFVAAHPENPNQPVFYNGTQAPIAPPHSGYSKLLLGLGAASLLAKWFITRQISKNMEGVNNATPNNVKIIIVNSPSQMLATSRLAKMAMLQSLPGRNLQRDSNDDRKDESLHDKETLEVISTDRARAKIARKILESSDTKIGSNLSALLKLYSVGSRVVN